MSLIVNSKVEGDGGAVARRCRSAGRLPLVDRKRAQRTTARRLVRVRTRIALTAEQRGAEPMGDGGRGFWTRLAEMLSALLVAIAIHGGIVAGTALIAGREPPLRPKIEQTIRVEVRERPSPPPPPIGRSIVEAPEPSPRARRIGQPRVQKALPQSTSEPPKEPLVRVVGLSFESTTEGGNGPAFAVGDTRFGNTADRAALPHAEDAGASVEVAPRNRLATRIPSQGVKYAPPKMKRKVEPIYPEMLKAQGLEADVTVLVSIGAVGEVIDVEIVKGSPYGEFNQAARATALKQEFEPELRDGVPIPSTLSWVYRFRLEGP
jgi:protein TonB